MVYTNLRQMSAFSIQISAFKIEIAAFKYSYRYLKLQMFI